MKYLETERLKLIVCDLPIIEAFFAGNDALAKQLGVSVHENWTEFGEPAFRWTYERITKPGADIQWWCYLPVHKADNMLIGSCGYKGDPDENGMIEIGYEICADYRNKGLASEAAKALIAHAFTNDKVKYVQAHTLADENASTNVLKKCGMQFVKEVNGPEDGLIWQWVLYK
ncbi:GNAT family N-acetyltransferase [soil metagenome]